MKSLSILAPFLILSFGARASFDDGMAAYQRGDYATAYQEFLGAANQGDGDALLNLEFMAESSATCGPPSKGFVPFLGNPAARVELFQKAAQDPRGTNLRFVIAYAALWSGGASSEQGKAFGPIPPLAEASAKQGLPLAMVVTAGSYANSKTPDQIAAYAWYSLAQKRGLDTKKLKDQVSLTEGNRARAEEMAQKMDKDIPLGRVIATVGEPACPRNGASGKANPVSPK